MRSPLSIIRLSLLSLVACALALTASGEPQTESLTAQQILDRMAKVYADSKSYRDSGVVKTEFISDTRGSRTVEKTFTTAFVRPDRFRFEYREKRAGGKEPQYIVWRDGKEVQTWSDLSAGIQKPESLGLAVAGAAGISSGSAHKIPSLLLPGEVGGRRLTDITDARRADDAKLDNADCFRIEGKYADAPLTLWIDKATFLVRRVDMQTENKGFRTQETTTYEPVLDGDVTAAMLALNPLKPS